MSTSIKSLHRLSNDYSEASQAECDLFAVKLSDGGWSIADGIGSNMTPVDAKERAGWHLPVRFETEETALSAIESGPDAMFDITLSGPWAQHCIAHGATECEAYAAP
jgi:hypothetical protein